MGGRITLNPESPGKAQKELEAAFHEFIVGQDRAIRRLVRRILYANSMSGCLRDMTKPAGSFFYLGPTGVGKTRLVEVFARLLFGRFDAMLKIDCSELQHSHEISRLIGAPPGYLGHDREPKLSQRRLDFWGFVTRPTDGKTVDIETIRAKLNELQDELQLIEGIKEKPENKKGTLDWLYLSAEENKIQKEINRLRGLLKRLSQKSDYAPGTYPAILLFDEIEKAHPALFDLLLQIHDKAKLTTHEMNSGGNNEVLFHNTFVFYTSNVAQRELKKLVRNSGIGFSPDKISDTDLDGAIYRTALDRLERKFSPEFLGRIGKENIIVFSHLTREQVSESLRRVLIPAFIKRFVASLPVKIVITDSAQNYLVDESFDAKSRAFGMRALEGVFKKGVEENLAGLVLKSKEEGGIIAGDEILIDMKDDKLLFSIKERTEAQIKEQKSVELISRNLASENDYYDRKNIATFKVKMP